MALKIEIAKEILNFLERRDNRNLIIEAQRKIRLQEALVNLSSK